jgi:hypothetical protein
MENNETNHATTQNTQANEVNYQQEYEKQKLEIERLKNAISKTNSENAEYKRQEADRKQKELDSLPELERLQKELEASQKATNDANARIAEMEHRQSGLENGFTNDEIAKLAGSKVDWKALKDIVTARVDAAIKSAKSEGVVNSTADSLLGNGTANKETKSDFQKHQESKNQKSTIVEL